MKNIAIILAGGSGRRVGGELPKQFLHIAGQTVLEYSLAAFQNNKYIDEIVLVTNPAFTEETANIAQNGKFPKVSKILNGGKERYHSTLSALQVFRSEECNLIIHDAVRPLVSDRIISENIYALKEYDACTTAVRSTDTILQSDLSHQYVEQIPDRDFLYNVQTPQSFKKDTLQRAYELAKQDPNFQSTDDCGVVRRYMPGTRIRIIEGSSSNIKLTYPEDIALIERLLGLK